MRLRFQDARESLAPELVFAEHIQSLDSGHWRCSAARFRPFTSQQVQCPQHMFELADALFPFHLRSRSTFAQRSLSTISCQDQDSWQVGQRKASGPK
jgi:hypothetical protein